MKLGLLRSCGAVLALVACGGNNKGSDAGSTDAGAYNQTPSSGTVTGTGISATVSNGECILMSPGGVSGTVGLVMSASQEVTDAGIVFTASSDPDGGFMYVNLFLSQLDAGVYTEAVGDSCGQVTFNFASSLNNGQNGWGAGLDCDGGNQEGTWTLTLTSVGPPVPNGNTGEFFYQVNGTLNATLPSIFVGPPPVQVNLSF